MANCMTLVCLALSAVLVNGAPATGPTLLPGSGTEVNSVPITETFQGDGTQAQQEVDYQQTDEPTAGDYGNTEGGLDGGVVNDDDEEVYNDNYGDNNNVANDGVTVGQTTEPTDVLQGDGTQTPQEGADQQQQLVTGYYGNDGDGTDYNMATDYNGEGQTTEPTDVLQGVGTQTPQEGTDQQQQLVTDYYGNDGDGTDYNMVTDYNGESQTFEPTEIVQGDGTQTPQEGTDQQTDQFVGDATESYDGADEDGDNGVANNDGSDVTGNSQDAGDNGFANNDGSDVTGNGQDAGDNGFANNDGSDVTGNGQDAGDNGVANNDGSDVTGNGQDAGDNGFANNDGSDVTGNGQDAGDNGVANNDGSDVKGNNGNAGNNANDGADADDADDDYDADDADDEEDGDDADDEEDGDDADDGVYNDGGEMTDDYDDDEGNGVDYKDEIHDEQDPEEDHLQDTTAAVTEPA